MHSTFIALFIRSNNKRPNTDDLLHLSGSLFVVKIETVIAGTVIILFVLFSCCYVSGLTLKHV